MAPCTVVLLNHFVLRFFFAQGCQDSDPCAEIELNHLVPNFNAHPFAMTPIWAILNEGLCLPAAMGRAKSDSDVDLVEGPGSGGAEGEEVVEL